MNGFLKGLTLAVAVTALAGTAQAAKYKVVDVANGGTITGKVSVDPGKVEVQTFTISKNPEVCGSGTREVAWVRANGDALMDAVVYLEKVKAGKPFPKEISQVTIDQKGCKFIPYLQILANGGKLKVVNDDPVLHNIHTYEIIKKARRTVFNVSQPNQGNTFTKTVKLRRGVAMKVECDAHDFMQGWVFVAKTPYFALVGPDGTFTIDNVPPGKYVVKSWHGRLGVKKATVKVAAGGSAEVSFAY